MGQKAFDGFEAVKRLCNPFSPIFDWKYIYCDLWAILGDCSEGYLWNCILWSCASVRTVDKNVLKSQK